MENLAVKSMPVKELQKQVPQLKPVLANASEKIDSFKSEVKTEIETVEPQLSEWMTAVEQRSGELVSGLDDLVKKYPMRAVAIALATGYSLHLIARKMSTKTIQGE